MEEIAKKMRKVFKYIAVLTVLELIISLSIFVPVQAAGSLTRSPAYGPPGTQVTLNGTGFNANTEINIIYDGDLLTADSGNTTTNASGGFTGVVITVPDNGNSTPHTITVSTDATHTASQSFSTPKITVSPANGIAGSTVIINGTGFASGDTGIAVLFNGQAVTLTPSSPAVSAGAWSASFTVPSIAAGSYNIGAYGNNTDATYVPEVSYTLNSSASISVNKSSGNVGTSVNVNGTGFTSGETVTIKYDNTTVVPTFTLSSVTTFSKSFTIPASASDNDHTITVTGSVTAAKTASFTVSPSIALNKTSGPSGTSITVTGSGFGAGESGITVTYDGQPVGTTTTASSTGAWNTTFTVPSGAAGAHPINAYGSSTAALSSPVSFTLGAGISTNTSSGTVGSSVTVSGTGFASNEKNIVVTFDGAQANTGTVTADAQGTWTATLVIPPSAAGVSHVINAQGATTKLTSASGVTFNTQANVASSQASGSASPGSTITLTGSGFAANEKNIIISVDDNPVVSNVTADSKGNWSSPVTIPPLSSGTHSIKVNGSVTQNLSLGSLSLKVKASISILPESGPVGASVTVKGSGFGAGSQVQFAYDDDSSKFNGIRATTDASGSFTKVVTIPRSTSGAHIISVSDNQSNTDSKTFTINSNPPTLPVPASPADGETIGLTGNATPTFRWSAAVSESAVSYELQIDSDPEFSNPIVDKTNLNNTRCTLSKAEALPQGTYYWRVKAVDAAGNASDWMAPWTIKSGVMSMAVLILIIMAAVAVLAVAAYFLIIRRLRQRRVSAGAAMPEIVVPEVVNAEYRTIESEDSARRRALPWRLALPQAPQQPKGTKSLSSEDQARLKVIIDFAKSLPLIEPGNNTDWLIDLAENDGGNSGSSTLYSQLLKDEIQVRYEPAWMKHPTFMDLQVLLEGQPILQDLNSYIESVNHTAAESIRLLQDIYKDTNGESGVDILNSGGWAFVSAVYTDTVSWFLGKYLREPSDRDYSVKPDGQSPDGMDMFDLFGEQNTPFAGPLVRATAEQNTANFRTLHLKLRRSYRNNDKARDVVGMITQLDVQRSRLLNAFSQFNRLNT